MAPAGAPPALWPAGWRDADVLWGAVYGEGPGYVALFSGRRPTPATRLEAPREAYFRWPHERLAALGWAHEQTGEGREVYHCAHLVGARRRRAADALPLYALYADLDAGLPPAPCVAPGILVASSPGRYQAYVRLDRPVPPARGADLNRRLARALGADPSGWDLSQLLRVPGSVNHKYAGAPPVRLVEVTGRAYAPAWLERVLPPLPPPAPARSAVAPPLPERPAPPLPLSRAAQAVWEGRDAKRTADGRVDRSASLVRLARLLHRAGLPPERLAAALAERDAALGWGKYAGRADAAEQYRRLAALVAAGPPTGRR